MPNKTITFGANLIPNGDLSYDLGSGNARWNIYGDVEGTSSENVVGNARIFYGTCPTAAATAIKEITCPKYDGNLTIGDMLIVKFDITNSAAAANLKLKFSGQADADAKPIKRQYNSTGNNNLLAVGELNKDSISVFIYNGTNWILTNADYNTNDNTLGYQIRVNNGTYVASRALYRYKMLFQKDETTLIPIDGTNYTAATAVTNRPTITQEPFLINGLYTYYNATATVNANAAISASYNMFQYPLDLRYTFNTGSTLTTNKDVYLVAQPSTDGIHATLRNPSASGTNASAQATGTNAGPITQILPNSEDGYIYIRLGHAYSTYQLALDIYHPVYWYKDGRLELYSGGSVRQIPTTGTYSDWRKLLVGAASSNDETTFTLSNDTIGNVYAVNTISIKPAAGILKAKELIGKTITIDNSADSTGVPHLIFSRSGWNYITIPENDASVLSVGFGEPGNNTNQRLVIFKSGTVRPGLNGGQDLGDNEHKWNKVYGVNFYGTFNGTATSAQQLAAREIDNSDLNQFSSGGALKYAWAGGNNGIDSKPTNVNAFGVIAMKTAASWTGQLLMSTDTEPGLYWRTNLTTETPSYGSWTPLASGNGGVYYGTCATAADVAEKVVVCKHYHTLKAGDVIVVTFTNSNTQAQPTLNVNNTGAVSVKMAYSGGIVDLGSTSQLRFTCTFIYDGTYWLIINQQNTIQLATSSGNVNWRSVLLSESNSVSENFTPSANTLGRTYAAHNVKYQPSTGTLRAPIMKTPKVQIEYDHVNKAHIEWNDTDSSIDFIFD